jgi:hypothetical protein
MRWERSLELQEGNGRKVFWRIGKRWIGESKILVNFVIEGISGLVRWFIPHCAVFSVSHWLFSVQFSFLIVQRSMFIVGCSMFIVHRWLFVIHCPFLIVQCPFLIVQCSFLIVQCSLLIVDCWLFSVQCLLLVDEGSLLIVKCALMIIDSRNFLTAMRGIRYLSVDRPVLNDVRIWFCEGCRSALKCK